MKQGRTRKRGEARTARKTRKANNIRKNTYKKGGVLGFPKSKPASLKSSSNLKKEEIQQKIEETKKIIKEKNENDLKKTMDANNDLNNLKYKLYTIISQLNIDKSGQISYGYRDLSIKKHTTNPIRNPNKNLYSGNKFEEYKESINLFFYPLKYTDCDNKSMKERYDIITSNVYRHFNTYIETNTIESTILTLTGHAHIKDNETKSKYNTYHYYNGKSQLSENLNKINERILEFDKEIKLDRKEFIEAFLQLFDIIFKIFSNLMEYKFNVTEEQIKEENRKNYNTNLYMIRNDKKKKEQFIKNIKLEILNEFDTTQKLTNSIYYHVLTYYDLKNREEEEAQKA